MSRYRNPYAITGLSAQRREQISRTLRGLAPDLSSAVICYAGIKPLCHKARIENRKLPGAGRRATPKGGESAQLGSYLLSRQTRRLSRVRGRGRAGNKWPRESLSISSRRLLDYPGEALSLSLQRCCHLLWAGLRPRHLVTLYLSGLWFTIGSQLKRVSASKGASTYSRGREPRHSPGEHDHL